MLHCCYIVVLRYIIVIIVVIIGIIYKICCIYGVDAGKMKNSAFYINVKRRVAFSI